MPTKGETRQKRRAARILDFHGVRSGCVLMEDTIIVHDYNGTGRTFEVDWDRNVVGEKAKSPSHWTRRCRKRRSFILL